MTAIAKTARVALAVAALALTTAGAASAGASHPDPFVSTGAPADVYPALHANPSDYYGRPLGSSWSSLTPAGWKWVLQSRVARFHLTIGGARAAA